MNAVDLDGARDPGGAPATTTAAASGNAQEARRLHRLAQEARRRALSMIHRAGLGHAGGDLSALDIVTTLYHAILRLDPERPRAPDRDRFILSKGHASGALYTTLAGRGLIPVAELDTYMQPLARLGGHPHCKAVPWVEASTGPLGHGLPIAVGAALAAHLSPARHGYRVFVLTGDGELQEGSNWEAAMAAAQYRLDNLVWIVDRNGLQQGAETEKTVGLEPLAAKIRAFGWAVRECDGHDHAALLELLGGVPFEPGRPSCLVAQTHKGQGVSFMRDRAAWHHKVPSAEQLAAALRELTDAEDARGAEGER